jgi:hypothetical protein
MGDISEGLAGRRALAALLIVLLLLVPQPLSWYAGDDGRPGIEATGNWLMPRGPAVKSYWENSTVKLPLGTFNYPPELKWESDLKQEVEDYFRGWTRIVIGDFDGKGGQDLVIWGDHLLRIREGRSGELLRHCRIVPSNTLELDIEGFLFLAKGMVEVTDLDEDGRSELLVVGEPTGSGPLPGFQLWHYDPWSNITHWKHNLGASRPSGFLMEDLNGDGRTEVLYHVKTVKSETFTCLDPADGRILWRASDIPDRSLLPYPKAFIQNATGSGHNEVYLGTFFRLKPGGGTGDIISRFLDAETQTFLDKRLQYTGGSPKGFALAQYVGDPRPELLVFLDQEVRVYDIVEDRRVRSISFSPLTRYQFVTWSAGDLDGDDLEEVAFIEEIPQDSEDDEVIDERFRITVLFPRGNTVLYSDMLSESTIRMFRGIPWGGLINLDNGKVAAYNGRDIGAMWELSLADFTSVKAQDLGLEIADFDADGNADFLVALKGEGGASWLGMFEPGEPRVRVLSATSEGRTCYAAYKDYEFAYDVVPKEGASNIIAYHLLVPDEPTPLASWTQKGFSNPFAEWVLLGANSRYFGLPGGGSRVIFSLNFTWACDLEEMQDLILRISFSGDEEEDHPFGNVFRVENDLMPVGHLYAVGSNGREIPPEGWVRTDESITVRGLRAAYEGAPDLHPPVLGGRLDWMEEGRPFNKSVFLDRGREVNVPLDTVEGIELGWMNFTLTVDTGSEASKGLDELLALRVDGSPPEVVDVFPSGAEWYGTKDITVGFTLADVGSGPDPTFMEYQTRLQGEVDFSDWITPDEFEAVPSDGRIVYFTTLKVREGADNLVRFRGCDVSTNKANASAPITIKVDTSHVGYPEHWPNDWTRDDPVTCGVRVRDFGPSGVNASSIEYRFGTRGPFHLGDWLDLGETGQSQSVTAEVGLTLLEGELNFIQWRAKDVAGNGPWLSSTFHVLLDRSVPTFGDGSPGPDELVSSPSIEFAIEVRDEASGVDGTTVEVAIWNATGEPDFQPLAGVISGGSVTARVQVPLENGRDNFVQFRVNDRAGNGPTTSEVFSIWADRLPINFSDFSPKPGVVVDGPDVVLNIKVSDSGGSGVDLATLEYSLWPSGEGYWRAWTPVGLWGIEEDYTLEVTVNLTPGHDNRIRFRGNDAVGTKSIESEGYAIWVNGPPTVALTRPSTAILKEGKAQVFNATVTDPDNDTVEVTWNLEDGTYLGRGHEVSLTLPVGEHTLVVWADDGHGHNVSTVRGFEVVSEDAEEEIHPGVWGLLAAVIVASFVVGYMVELRRQRGRSD